jgi:hypothetical protein
LLFRNSSFWVSVGVFWPGLLALSSITLTADFLTLAPLLHTCCLFVIRSQSLPAYFCYAPFRSLSLIGLLSVCRVVVDYIWGAGSSRNAPNL